MKWRVVYFVAWLLTVVAYSLPWASAGGKTYTGWNFTIPFSITYVIGMVLGLVVLTAKYKPISMTIIAGVLMLLGITGATLGYEAMAVLEGITGAKAEMEAGIGAAFLFVIVYMILGAYAGRKLIVKKNQG